ncbi:germin-like protein 9-3 [Cornus florida]|uniref:germin-like protein 9-3 n=1 Tax=Cornus florida TaxID=4283 RepID=UPI0028A1288E|nr:germin-like protein 9-3 [Cornus florida]
MAKSLVLLVVLVFFTTVQATNPNSDADFTVPSGMKIDGDFFTYTGLRGSPSSSSNGIDKKTVTMKNFPALDGMGISMELLEFSPGAVNVPHTHPRGAEIMFVVDGALTVGTTDSTGQLYKNDLQKGDVFVFPTGMVHYQANFDKSNKAIGVSAFSSVNAGTIDLPKNIFGSNMPGEVLAKAFKISADTVRQLETNQM